MIAVALLSLGIDGQLLLYIPSCIERFGAGRKSVHFVLGIFLVLDLLLGESNIVFDHTFVQRSKRLWFVLYVHGDLIILEGDGAYLIPILRF